MNVELITKEKSHRGRIVPLSSIDPHEVRDYQAYVTLCPFADGIYEHMKSTATKTHPRGTVAGYAGYVFCRWIYWDFDGDDGDLLSPYMDAKRLVNYLINGCGVPDNDIAVYFSGGKGFHVSISADHVGGIDPADSETMAANVRAFTEKVIDEIEAKYSVKFGTFDEKLYSVNRYFRLPNSKHDQSGLYKVPLTIDELLTLNKKEKIKALASSPRPDFSYNFSKKVLPKKDLQRLWALTQAGSVTTEQEKEALAELPEDEASRFKLAVKFTQEKISKEDYFNKERNNYTFLLAAWCNDLGIGEPGVGDRALELILLHREKDLGDDPKKWDHTRIRQTVLNAYSRLRRKWGRKQDYIKQVTDPRRINYEAQLKLTEDVLRLAKSSSLRPREILRITMALNASTKHPLPDEQVYEIVVNNTKGRVMFTEKDMPVPIYQLAGDYVEKAKRTSGNRGIGIPPIDEAENYDYEGKVCQVIGQGGVGKSIFLKDILDAGSRNKELGIYSTMEDTALRLFERVLRGVFDPEYAIDPETAEVIDQVSALARLRNLSRTDSQQARRIISEKLKEVYGNYFLVDERVGMSMADYEETLKFLLNKYGNISTLGIDGLSTMSTQGMGEIEAAIKNSFDVKALANNYKLFIPCLVHTPGDVSRTKRNLWDHTRGGPKVMQNADFFICLSAIQDDANSQPGNPAYFNDMIYLKYWGKRTSGQYLDLILKLDTTHLTWQVSEETADSLSDLF